MSKTKQSQSTQMDESTTTENILLDKLVPYKQVIFKPYVGLRLERMTESIKENGIWEPIIVRPIDDTYYEILSGHNRVEAARRAGLTTVPAIVKEGLSDEEALLIVTESNLLQRSFQDMLPSERAVAIYNHYESIKNQGKRTDLVKSVEEIHKNNDYGDCETCTPMGTKQKSLDITGQEFALARTSIARYIRVYFLVDSLKTRLDGDKLKLRPSVELSYLSDDVQHIVNDVLSANHYKVTTAKAQKLRRAFEKKKYLEFEEVMLILGGEKIKENSPEENEFMVGLDIVSKYFTSDMESAEVEEHIKKALEFYNETLSKIKAKYFTPDKQLDEIEATIGKALDLYLKAAK